MSSFQLTEPAYRDLDEILAYLVDEAGADLALRVRLDLFETFERLADLPGLGHKRQDLTHRPLSFFTTEPYFVIFDPNSQPLIIHAVLHSSRNLKRVLRSRPM